ncbi:DNA cytosine methyltransferase [Bacteroides caecimuris]|uniref:DNA cytosine methyltransferase n=1 Tax=Bacteroides caecimuris TaxID=1796613 RepID=UPI0026F198E4|nr:DNA cytosine methyltransferase [Bacteroides caecimuris]
MAKKQLTFIDLFAGLGGFHQALSQLGCICVFSSELKVDLQQLYKINFPDTPIYGDITKIEPSAIPSHDILCAGFPCQPFSQAGKRQGFNDEKERGNLFYYICGILKEHNPKYVILENVANLKGHDNGNTWSVISTELDKLGYSVKAEILSPHQFGIPQHRKRIYIVCLRKDFGNLDNFEFPKGDKNATCNIKSIINEHDEKITPLKPETLKQLEVWQKFIDQTIAHGDTIPTFPIWAMEFGATYRYEDLAPAFQSYEELKGTNGKLGVIVKGVNKEQCLNQLPIYAQTKSSRRFPQWKIRYISLNRNFYARHKCWIDEWRQSVETFDNSHLKFEWNCGKDTFPIIEDKIVQFRASGIRVKLPTFSPALNLVGTQIPIFPWITLPEKHTTENIHSKGRYMTLYEAASVQGMQGLSFGSEYFRLPLSRCYEALGNAVNVEVVKKVAEKLLDYGK